MRRVHVIISGRVQGIGYRAWTERAASERGLSGWVRNRRDGTVEAVFAGDDQSVDAMLAACRSGPSAAHVTDLTVTSYEDTPPSGFALLSTS